MVNNLQSISFIQVTRVYSRNTYYNKFKRPSVHRHCKTCQCREEINPFLLPIKLNMY